MPSNSYERKPEPGWATPSLWQVRKYPHQNGEKRLRHTRHNLPPCMAPFDAAETLNSQPLPEERRVWNAHLAAPSLRLHRGVGPPGLWLWKPTGLVCRRPAGSVANTEAVSYSTSMSSWWLLPRAQTRGRRQDHPSLFFPRKGFIRRLVTRLLI